MIVYANCRHGQAMFSCFRPEGGGPAEYHLMIKPYSGRGLESQLAVVEELEQTVRRELGEDIKPVFARYFLSDPANQMLELPVRRDCAVSVVGQAPIGSVNAKVVLWLCLREGVETELSDGGMLSALDQYGQRELWQGTRSMPGCDSLVATRKLLKDYAKDLEKNGCTLSKNCHRTWFFVRDIDTNYGGVVRGRNEVFADMGLSRDTHFIASTGIGGNGSRADETVLFDAYALQGVGLEKIRYLKGSSHLNPTAEYGVAFERGTSIELADRRRVFISGTASIDNKGQIVHGGDIERQTARMCENVEVLLGEAGCGREDIQSAIVYVRDPADAAVVESIISERYEGMPFVTVLAPVCRPGWLVEMEVMAMR